jgi:hypothetical protein
MLHSILEAISRDYQIPLDDLRKYVPPEYRKKRRGRKQKHEYIETEEWTYAGHTYLLDTEGNVYTYDIERPRLIGYRSPSNSLALIKSN